MKAFVVRDATGFSIAYLYFEDDFKRNWASLGGMHTKDQARTIANAIARLPELLAIEKTAKSGVPNQAEEG